jgi:hypothetical protein
MKKLLKRIFLFLVLAFVAIQFFRPQKNIHEGMQANTIANVYPVSDTVHSILKTACYDCHSNNTAYPWYNNIQPVAWWLKHHVDEGKRELNFDEFASYSPRRKFNKLGKINEEVKEGGMPLSSYTLIHTNAKLSDEQKRLIAGWVVACQDSLKAHYPMDSLKRPNGPRPTGK